MKKTFILATACLAALTAFPASAQLLGGGGGLGGGLGGALGGAGGSLGGTLNGSGGIGLDRAVDLENGHVSAKGSGSGRADGAAGGSLSHKGKSHGANASGSASGSASGGLTADTLGTNDVANAVGGVRDQASQTAGAARDRAITAGAAAQGQASATAQAARRAALDRRPVTQLAQRSLERLDRPVAPATSSMVALRSMRRASYQEVAKPLAPAKARRPVRRTSDPTGRIPPLRALSPPLFRPSA